MKQRELVKLFVDAKAMARDYISLACSELAIENILRASRQDEVDVHKSVFGNDNDSLIIMIELDLNDYGKNSKC